MLDIAAIDRTLVATAPFKFFLAPGVLSPVDLAAVRADFPKISEPGLFPLSEMSYGPAFARLIEAIRSPDLEAVIARKLGADLRDKPMMITVRSHCRARDGRIHTDIKPKLVTCLLYLNDIWDESAGRLRLLRSGNDLDDYVAEIPPDGGTLVAFLRSDNSWHGHYPYAGERRYIMFNWMASAAALSRQLVRHTLSAKLKRGLARLMTTPDT